MSTTNSGIFSTQEVRLWNNPQLTTSKEIFFPKSTVAPPTLPHGLNFLDIDMNANIRIKAYTSNTTNTGFTAHVDAWADTVLYTGGFSWLNLYPGALEFDSGEFATTEDHPWDQPKTQTSRRINFKRDYITPPKVICFLNQLDLDKNHNWRAKTYVTDIDTKGFTLHIDTWGDTILYSATSGWVAYPEDRAYIFSGTSNIMDVRPWNAPQSENHQAIGFRGVEFWKKPDIFIALNSLDIGNNSNLRLKCYADNISTTGFTWHIDSWSSTTLYSAGVSYLCTV